MKKAKTIEDICIHKIQKGINSLRTGHRNPVECEADLEFSFKKLKSLNNNMFEALQLEYLLERIKIEQKYKVCV